MTADFRLAELGWKPTREMKSEAARNPGGWVYEIEGTFGPNDAVPGSAVKRAWEVDRHGRLTGRYVDNEKFDSR